MPRRRSACRPRGDLRGAGQPPLPRRREVPYTVLVNPELTPLGDQVEDGWEGCLSVPGMRGGSCRAIRRLRYRGRDLDGAPIERTSTASTPAWCSTRWTTLTASYIRCESAAYATSASRSEPYSRRAAALPPD